MDEELGWWDDFCEEHESNDARTQYKLQLKKVVADLKKRKPKSADYKEKKKILDTYDGPFVHERKRIFKTLGIHTEVGKRNR